MLLEPENPVTLQVVEDSSYIQPQVFSTLSSSCDEVSYPDYTSLMLFQLVHILLKSRTPDKGGLPRYGQTKRSEVLPLHSLDTTLLSMKSRVPGTLWAKTQQCWQRVSLQKPVWGGKRVRTAMRDWESVKE